MVFYLDLHHGEDILLISLKVNSKTYINASRNPPAATTAVAATYLH